MEKTLNKFYKAVAILCFVFASIAAASMLLSLVSWAWSLTFASWIIDEAFGYPASDIVGGWAVIYMIYIVGSIVLMYVEGAIFLKLSNQTDEEAASSYSKALTWAILSFFFGGLLIGGLALAGVLTTHNTQKERYLKGTSKGTTVTAEPAQNPSAPRSDINDRLSTENMERAKQRLVKLEELKTMGAVNEEEYAKLRAEIIGELTASKAQKDISSEKAARIAKLETLKNQGALTEEEFESLKNKILFE